MTELELISESRRDITREIRFVIDGMPRTKPRVPMSSRSREMLSAGLKSAAECLNGVSCGRFSQYADDE